MVVVVAVAVYLCRYEPSVDMQDRGGARGRERWRREQMAGTMSVSYTRYTTNKAVVFGVRVSHMAGDRDGNGNGGQEWRRKK